MARSAPLNNPIAKEEYLALCRHAPELAHDTLNQGTGGPNSISFQKCGSTARGYPLRELLNLSSASQLDETSAAEISSFMGSGVTEVRLVIWVSAAALSHPLAPCAGSVLTVGLLNPRDRTVRRASGATTSGACPQGASRARPRSGSSSRSST